MNRSNVFALLTLATTIATAQTPPAPVSVSSLNEALAEGKFSLNSRLRWESVDQTGLMDANAATIGTRFGYTTAAMQGFQAMIEADNVVALSDRDRYNATGTNPGGAGRAAIGDPPGTGINQAWLSYTSDYAMIKAGRQRMRLDNMRFVGDAAWRQNMMTFDAVTATHEAANHLNFHYSYIWRVSRPFFNEAPQPDFDSNSHLLNVSYSGLTLGKLTAYGYFLDFDNAPANSSNTLGASFAGSSALTADLKLNYRAEYATQAEAGENPVDYRADYYLLELGAEMAPFSFGVGYEVLGSDDGVRGFSTPIAGLHPFNGWADVFTATPPTGLRDFHLSAGVDLPRGFPVRIAYHDFDTDFGDDNGSEWDVMVSHRFDKNWAVFAQAAFFDRDTPELEVTKVYLWLQFDY